MCHTSGPYPSHIKEHLFQKNIFFFFSFVYYWTIKRKRQIPKMRTHIFRQKIQNPLSVLIVPYGFEVNQSFNIFVLLPCQTICNAWKSIFKSTLKSCIPKVHFCLRLWFCCCSPFFMHISMNTWTFALFFYSTHNDSSKILFDDAICLPAHLSWIFIEFRTVFLLLSAFDSNFNRL